MIAPCHAGGYFAQIMSNSLAPQTTTGPQDGVRLRPIDLGGVVIERPVILAPMSGVTDLPYRRLARRLGAGLVVSEMIASWAMVRENQATLRMAQTADDGGPNAVQLAGCEPDAMAEAARIAVDRGADLDRHQLRLPGEEGGGGPAGRLGADARRAPGGAAAGGDGGGGAGAGHAEDAHGLGPRQPERPGAGADRAGVRHPHDHRARAHPAAVLQRPGGLGLRRAGEGGGVAAGDRQRRHPGRRGRAGGAGGCPAPTA